VDSQALSKSNFLREGGALAINLSHLHRDLHSTRGNQSASEVDDGSVLHFPCHEMTFQLPRCSISSHNLRTNATGLSQSESGLVCGAAAMDIEDA